jgi:hypothetical protein
MEDSVPNVSAKEIADDRQNPRSRGQLGEDYSALKAVEVDIDTLVPPYKPKHH